MGLHYYHLGDPEVRSMMRRLWLDEVDDLVATSSRQLCYGRQLTDAGWNAYDDAMPQALEFYDDEWLVAQLSDADFWQPYLMRQGRRIDYDVTDAIEKLAVGEFNIAYVRGLATTLQSRGDEECTIYRADAAYTPRGECSSWEGTTVDLAAVLAGHRARYYPPPGDREAFMIPTGPHCHHSIRSV